MVTSIATEEGKVVWRETNSGSTCRTKILALFMADGNDPVRLSSAKDTPFVLEADQPSR